MTDIIKNDYLDTLRNINNQIDAMIYEIDNFTSENPLKIPVEFKHDSFPIIRRLKEAKRNLSKNNHLNLINFFAIWRPVAIILRVL